VVVLLSLGAGGYVYFGLLPSRHFHNPPVLSTISNTTTNTTKAAPKPKPQVPGFNVLLIGVDARFANENSRSDSLMLVHVDLSQHNYQLLSIPRDTRVDLPGYGLTKITHAHILGDMKGGDKLGVQYTINAVSKLTGVQINYYAETNYWGLGDLVNSIGGINVNVPFRMVLTHPWYPQDLGMVIQPGTHFYKGKMVSEITHERYSLPHGDFSRQKMQEEVILGIIRSLKDPKNITRIPSLVQTLPKFLISTNMTTQDLLSLAISAKDFNSSDLHYYQVPGQAANNIFDAVLGQKDDEFIADKQGLQQIVDEHFLS
jgi:LCP family protein required for cell wall assembly